ncbi:alpha/beta-hydrolase [Atractiella rhizophila]|nr:alpha/beta-hydrolase [Atractiella rhizophila]
MPIKPAAREEGGQASSHTYLKSLRYATKAMVLLTSIALLSFHLAQHVFAAPATTTRKPIATTWSGIYEGFTNTTTNTDWFLGIPYAQTPPDRFKASKPLGLSTSLKVHDAKHWGPVCPQTQQGSSYGTNYNGTVSEDCLYLNVVRPANIGLKPLPVLVWIYGGGFTDGAASQYDPTAIVTRSMAIGEPVIYVAMNYRLNAFGFLQHSQVTQPQDYNLGLTDQLQALKWIKANILAFGGDPTQMTIWGESAGGGSVETHVLYGPPGLFRAGAIDSGYILRGFNAPSDTPFWTLANYTGCGTQASTTPQAAYDCLRALPFAQLLAQSQQVIQGRLAGYAPVVAGNYVTESPRARVEGKRYNRVPLIQGTNKNEGFATGTNTHETFVAAVQLSLNVTTAKAEEIVAAYENDASLQGASYTTMLGYFSGDTAFLASTRFLASHFVQTQSVFSYHFSQPPPGPFGDTAGAYHSSELHWPFATWPTDGTASDPAAFLRLQNEFIDYWINFINKKDPNGNTVPAWPSYSTGQDIQFTAVNGTAPISDDFRKTATTLIAELLG